MSAALISVAATGIAVALMSAQTRAAGQQLDHRASLVGAATSGQLNRYVEILTVAAAGLGTARPLTADAFQRATTPLRALGLSGVPAITFVVPVRDAEVPAAQSRWRARGSGALTLVPDRDVDEHLFGVLTRSLDGSESPRTGGDLARAPAAAAALFQARATAQVTVSEPYEFLRDRVLPPSTRQLSFVIAAPVFGAPEGARHRPLRGWLVLGLRGQDFITATLQAVSQDLVDVTLLVAGAGGSPVTVANLRTSSTRHRDLHRSFDLPVAQTRWSIRIDAVAAQLPGAGSAVPATTTVIGLLIALLAAMLITGRARADTRVRAATAELVDSTTNLRTELDARLAAEAHLATERTRLTQILDALEVSVITCDSGGTITHLNRAARELHRLMAHESTVAEHGRRLILTDTDGTPIPESELPLNRSLRGEIVDGWEIVATADDGTHRTLRWHSRPLGDPDGTAAGAVASSYDITTLREHQAELAAFAGVVAHDLKSPLTAITGYTRLATTALAAGVPLHTPVAHLGRVLDATRRMDHLIDELLRYAAARDAYLDLTEINLGEMTDTVVADRLTEYAAQPDTPAPHVFVGPLPTVRADATMMRQLLDNLIGNCFKYTPPGQPARLDITATTSGTGELDLTIADRGIGIPPGEHDAVFTSFHRADHRGAYSGAGLGLAICQRIAQRHGGRITATDNPGGGTRIVVTLPTATTSTARRPELPSIDRTPHAGKPRTA